jgi:hypothetical protein
MVMCRGAQGYWRDLRCFNYVYILCSTFPHVTDACSIFFFDVVSDGGKVFCVYCTVFWAKYYVFFLLDGGCSPSAVLFVPFSTWFNSGSTIQGPEYCYHVYCDSNDYRLIWNVNLSIDAYIDIYMTISKSSLLCVCAWRRRRVTDSTLSKQSKAACMVWFC